MLRSKTTDSRKEGREQSETPKMAVRAQHHHSVNLRSIRKSTRLHAASQQAVRKRLQGLPLHQMDGGRFSVPVLEAKEGGIPFSMTLDLYRGLTEMSSSDIGLRPNNGLFSLQYILDGSGQLVQLKGQREALQSGDSILAPHGHTYIQADDSSQPDKSRSEWQLASVTLLLPKDVLSSKSGSAQLERIQDYCGRNKEAERFLTEAEAAQIVAGARETAQAAAGQRHVLHNNAGGSFGGEKGDVEPGSSSRRVTEGRDDPLTASAQATVADATRSLRLRTAAGARTSPSAETHIGSLQEDLQDAVSSLQESSDSRSQAEDSRQSRDGPQDSQLPFEMPSTSGTEQAGPGHQHGSSCDHAASNGKVSAEAAAFLSPSPSEQPEVDKEHGGPRTLDSIRAFLSKLAKWRQGSGQPVVLKRSLSELNAFRLPHQTNRLALVFDPLGDQVDFTFGVEIFEPGHRTTPHFHQHAHELFFILAGEGEGFCDDERFPLAAGDVVVFPPGSMHGIDVAEGSKMYCLEIMQPNDMFAELVRAGMPAGSLLEDDLCILIASGCS